VEGAHTLDMGGRGIQSRVIAGMNQPWGTSRSCTGCGKCVQVCPTGALFKKGSSAAEMVKQLDFLTWILDGREKKIYHWS
jgi:bidirectional [NiFe] hydrogenase diaphorase subunit